MSDSEIKPGDNRLRGIDPEKLLVLEIDEIHPMLEVQYPDLPKRAEELLAKAIEWATKHKRDGVIVILNDAEMNHASDVYKQLLGFAGDTGEVEETRKKVKLKPFQAAQSIDAWFKNKRERLVGAMGVIDAAQNARANKVRADEQAQRARIAREADELAQKLIADAKKADAPDIALDIAMEAESIAEEARAAAGAPSVDLTRTRSTMGVTTSQSEKWDYTVTSIRELCAAVAAGKVSDTFVVAGDAAIRLAIKGRGGTRTIPGLEIFPDYRMNRRGAK
jgi:hypothetical protein